jgi:hypothetical protein
MTEPLQAFLTLAIGFAVAGLFAQAYQLVTARPLSFRVAAETERTEALGTVPILVIAAPFLIMRHLVLAGRIERREITLVAIATVIAGFWSLMSGTVVAAGWIELVRLVG